MLKCCSEVGVVFATFSKELDNFGIRHWQSNRHHIRTSAALSGRAKGAYLIAIRHSCQEVMVFPPRHFDCVYYLDFAKRIRSTDIVAGRSSSLVPFQHGFAVTGRDREIGTGRIPAWCRALTIVGRRLQGTLLPQCTDDLHMRTVEMFADITIIALEDTVAFVLANLVRPIWIGQQTTRDTDDVDRSCAQ